MLGIAPLDEEASKDRDENADHQQEGTCRSGELGHPRVNPTPADLVEDEIAHVPMGAVPARVPTPGHGADPGEGEGEVEGQAHPEGVLVPAVHRQEARQAQAGVEDGVQPEQPPPHVGYEGVDLARVLPLQLGVGELETREYEEARHPARPPSPVGPLLHVLRLHPEMVNENVHRGEELQEAEGSKLLLGGLRHGAPQLGGNNRSASGRILL
mmetsp:Transcript_17136/g.53733  ORF Transcript_17136/g.53733 Transcript_17136/m.53733 type:complete len:212 (+) Transcript_17136:661-1296(+)